MLSVYRKRAEDFLKFNTFLQWPHPEPNVHAFYKLGRGFSEHAFNFSKIKIESIEDFFKDFILLRYVVKFARPRT